MRFSIINYFLKIYNNLVHNFKISLKLGIRYLLLNDVDFVLYKNSESLI